MKSKVLWRLTPLALIALTLAAGILGPRFSSNGLSTYQGAQHKAAEEALIMATVTLDNPIERGLLVQNLKVVAV